MKYRLRRESSDIGTFSIEELRQRRESGEFNGREDVQVEGAPGWRRLDELLGHAGNDSVPPMIPEAPKAKGVNWTKWIAAAAAAVALVGVGRHYAPRVIRHFHPPPPRGLAIASKPAVRASTPTQADVLKRIRAFNDRQWIEGYEKRGVHNSSTDKAAELFLRVFIDRYFEGPESGNPLALDTESNRLGQDPNVTDPLILTVAAYNSVNWYDKRHRYERALNTFPSTSHRAYPAFFAAVSLMSESKFKYDEEGELNVLALRLFPQCFTDGSFTPADQQEIANIFVDGWGSGFFEINSEAICEVARQAGPQYEWLAAVLDGERCIVEAWRDRGSGYSYTVSAEGHRTFKENLTRASGFLTKAYHLEPTYPMAPCLMIYVSLGLSGLEEMRTWFDRTLAVQFDYITAWSNMRWGLRPRWYGSELAMLAFGKMALDTGRFDTNVPRVYLSSVSDLESEERYLAGVHLYGDPRIWPDLARMYEGYIAEPTKAKDRPGWRTAYATVAYFAGKYDVARAQLDALGWKTDAPSMAGWGADLSGMALDVAARTGPLKEQVSVAETAGDNGAVAKALKLYSDMDSHPIVDERTKEFVRLRKSRLGDEMGLTDGRWISLMPSKDNDPNWVYSFGEARRGLGDSLDVEYGRKGHMIYSKTPVGSNFEVRGSFQNLRLSNKNFQAGIVMGLPDFGSYNWYGFRIKRHDEEGDVVCFGIGWSLTEIVQRFPLNDTSNSFDFIFQDGLVTATVNGEKIFQKAEPPQGISVMEGAFVVGLGAFSDSDDDVIRYHDVEIRRLPSGQNQSAEPAASK